MPVKWKEITEEQFNYWRDCVPPIWSTFSHDGFCVGEPSDHVHGIPTYQGCKRVNGKFYASTRPVTAREFMTISGAVVLDNLEVQQ